MKELVATNIKQTIEKLNSKNASMNLELSGFYYIPVFSGQKANIVSAQQEYFGFYTLANAI